MRLSVLLEKSDIAPFKGKDYDPDIRGVAINSKEVHPGWLFVAIKGFVTDGHHYIDQAKENGAVAVVGTQKTINVDIAYIPVSDSRQLLSRLAAVFYDFSRIHNEMKIIGITGTNGKSTTAIYLRHFLESAGISCGLVGTIFYAVGGKKREAERTTPESHVLHSLISEMYKTGDKAMVMEVSSHALELCRVDDIRFDAAAFTNLSPEHLDFHGDMESYFQAKLKLFNKLLGKDGIAIINSDDSYGKKIFPYCRNFFSVGRIESSNWNFKITGREENGFQFDLKTPNGNYKLTAPVIGDYNIENIVLALAVAVSIYPKKLSAFIESVSSLPQISGRLQRVSKNIFVDYSHTPDALEKALQTLKFPGKTLTVVFGAGGNRDRQKRPLMGRAAVNYADKIILTNDNPRKENPESIVKEILSGIDDQAHTIIRLDREKAISEAVIQRKSNEIVLIAGKGHENYQEIGDTRRPFNDAEIALKVLG